MQTRHRIKDFVPLIVLLALIILLTSIAALLSETFSPADMARMFMGFFFLVFGSFKAVRPRAFAEAYAKYDLLAMRSRAYALIYPFIEIGLAILYLWNIAPTFTNIFTFVLMVFGAVGVYLKLKKGEEVMCACLGTVFTLPMTYVTLGEDLVMATMALAMLVV